MRKPKPLPDGAKEREKDFANCLSRSLDGVEERLTNGLIRLEHDQELVRGLTGFPWIITIPVNAT